MSLYRLVLADHHAMLRESIGKMLSEIIDLEVAGEASDGQELFPLLNRSHPDLVVLDIAMPHLGGVEVTQKIKEVYPQIKILILTMEKNIDYLCQALSFGVEGYLLEEEGILELFSAIRTIRQGGTYISPRLALLLPADLMTRCRFTSKAPSSVTSREREILRLIAEGKSNSEIADLLFISVRTVEHHRASVMNKLSLRRITDLIKYAIRNGYTPP